MNSDATEEQVLEPPIATAPTPSKSHLLRLVLIAVSIFFSGLGIGYFLFSDKHDLPHKSQINHLVSPTLTSALVTTTPLPSPSLQPTSFSKRWVWRSAGCGSTAACSYTVCASDDTKTCYSCIGKYNKSSSSGEITPSENEDPRSTHNFTCKLD